MRSLSFSALAALFYQASRTAAQYGGNDWLFPFIPSLLCLITACVFAVIGE